MKNWEMRLPVYGPNVNEKGYENKNSFKKPYQNIAEEVKGTINLAYNLETNILHQKKLKQDRPLLKKNQQRY